MAFVVNNAASGGASLIVPIGGPPGLSGQDGADGRDGVDGRDGTPGAGAVASRAATTTVPAWCAVIEDGAGCRPADPTNPAHYGRVLGVTAAGGASGALVSITKIGDLTGAAGPFAANKTLWIGAGGVLAEAPVDGDWRQSVGVSSTVDRIVVTLDAPRRIRTGGPVTLPPITSLVDALTPEVLSAVLTPEVLAIVLAAFQAALPPLPADDSLIPPEGGWFSTPTGFVRISSAS